MDNRVEKNVNEYLECSDDMKPKIQQDADRKKTILTLEDMTNLIIVYDAVKKLNIVLLGVLEVRQRNRGVLGALGSVFDVINNGICAELKLLEEDEGYEQVICVLDDDTIEPGERARWLLGMK